MRCRGSLFDSEFLQKAERLRIAGRRRAEGFFHGRRLGSRVGTGQEFVDRREYVAGDDFRHIDWSVFARHGDLLIKRFHEPGDLPVHILIDCSRSMTFGGPPKFDLARQIAGALGYIALSGLDRVSITGFADGVGPSFPLTRGHGQFALLLDFLEDLSPFSGSSDLEAAVHGMLKRNPPKGVVLVISDLFFSCDLQPAIDPLVHQGFEPHIIQIYSPEEACPDLSGSLQLVDAESGSTQTVTVDKSTCESYRCAFEAFLQSVRATARSYRMCLTQTTSDCPYDVLILELMREARSIQA